MRACFTAEVDPAEWNLVLKVHHSTAGQHNERCLLLCVALKLHDLTLIVTDDQASGEVLLHPYFDPPRRVRRLRKKEGAAWRHMHAEVPFRHVLVRARKLRRLTDPEELFPSETLGN